MKKCFVIFMALIIILSTMCGLTISANQPSADAPIYHFVAGPVEGKNNTCAKALGQTVINGEWNDDYEGMFPLMLTLENTTSGASGLVYIQYDATKVKPKAANTDIFGTFSSWKDAATGNEVAFASEYSAQMNVNIVESGVDTTSKYAFIVWNGSKGAINADYWNGLGYMAELGTFVFETLEGVTVGDFDENTFVLADAASVGRSPLSLVADGDKVYGITGTDMNRIPMTVKFTYPMKAPEPPAPTTYDVVFVVEGKTIETITKNVGETLAVKDFPVVEEREGYTFAWDTTEDIKEAKTVTGAYTKLLDNATAATSSNTVSVNAYYDDAVSGEVMIALYSGKEMVGFKKLNNKTNMKVVEETVSYLGNAAPDTVKVMVWGDFVEVKPVVVAKEIRVK